MKAFLTAILAVLAIAANAADLEEPPRRQIEEIIVTAQKKAENVQDVPISITTLDGEFLREMGIDSIPDVVRLAPSLFLSERLDGNVFIRGFGTPFGGSAFDPAVSLAVDGLSMPQFEYLADPFYDIERVEVLRGPQGTLFGKNTTAGLLNVTTRAPTRELEAALVGEVGGLGVRRVEAGVGGPIPVFGDRVRFRLAGVASDGEGDVENTKLGVREPGLSERAGRVKLAFDPVPDLETVFIADIAAIRIWNPSYQQSDFRDSFIEFLRRYDPRFEDDGFNHRNATNFPKRLEKRSRRLQTNARLAIGDVGWLSDATAEATVGYSDIDMDFAQDLDHTPADLINLRSPTDFHYDQVSAEVRGLGKAPAPFGFGDLELLAGLFVFQSNFMTDTNVVTGEDFDDWLLSAAAYELATGDPPPGGTAFEDVRSAAAAFGVTVPASTLLAGDGGRIFFDQRARSAAGFGNVTWRPNERWAFGVGVRVTYEEKTGALATECFEPGLLCAFLGAEDFERSLAREKTDVSPRVTLQYFPIEDLSLFAIRATGFKSGGFNNFSTSPEQLEVDDERAVSWEVGAKGRLLDGTLAYAGTLFYMEVDDLQQQTIRGSLVQVRNAASARSRGFELDSIWLTPWQPLSIVAGGSFVDARYQSFPNAVAPATSEAPDQDLSGRRVPFVPEWQVNLIPRLAFPFRMPDLPFVGRLAEPLTLTAAMDVLARGGLHIDTALDPRTRQRPHVIVNARTGFSALDEALSLTLGISNLTNADVLTSAANNLAFPTGLNVFQEFQRNWSLEAVYRW